MKIFNRAKTHFMQKSESGAYNAKFGKIKEVQDAINAILDGKNNHPAIDKDVDYKEIIDSTTPKTK